MSIVYALAMLLVASVSFAQCEIPANATVGKYIEVSFDSLGYRLPTQFVDSQGKTMNAPNVPAGFPAVAGDPFKPYRDASLCLKKEVAIRKGDMLFIQALNGSYRLESKGRTLYISMAHSGDYSVIQRISADPRKDNESTVEERAKVYRFFTDTRQGY